MSSASDNAPALYRSIEDVIRDLEANPVEKGGNVYHPIPFPEFAHLKTSTNPDEVRLKWAAIEATVLRMFPQGAAGLRVLDIGANAGFYSYSLAADGATVTAFEPHPRYGPIGKFLVHEKDLRVDWRDCAFSPELVRGQSFDATLMLSVFQWMADGGGRMTEAAANLRAVSDMSRCLVFELGFNTGRSCLTTRKLNHYGELIRFLRANTSYRSFRLLRVTRLWRSSRILSRTRIFGGNPRFLVLCSNDQRFDDSPWRKLLRSIRL